MLAPALPSATPDVARARPLKAADDDAPVPARVPRSMASWSTIGGRAFIHGCKCESVLLNASELAFVSKFPLVVIGECGNGRLGLWLLPTLTADRCCANREGPRV